MSDPAQIDALLRDADACLARRDCRVALTTYDRAEHAGADDDRCSGGRWMANMLLGQYEQAWRESDAIRSRGAEDRHRFWQGDAIDGKRLMLRCLRGYGDTVMYLRWLPELIRRCSRVTVQACPEMLPLLACMPGNQQIVNWNTDEAGTDAWDVQIESAELPYLFRATTATLPSPTRFLFREETLHSMRALLGTRTKPRVGLVWSGSNYDPARSIPFAQFRLLLNTHAVEFWSLQAKENNTEWREFCGVKGWSQRCFYRADESHSGVADMAAFASEMDLVITIDTMAAHVAGSLGLPTWLLLKREADWRWMIGRDDSPWYPTMRLFRQSSAGDWSDPLVRVCDALRDFCEEQQA